MKTNSKLICFYSGTAKELRDMTFLQFIVTVQSNSAVMNSYRK